MNRMKLLYKMRQLLLIIFKTKAGVLTLLAVLTVILALLGFHEILASNCIKNSDCKSLCSSDWKANLVLWSDIFMGICQLFSLNIGYDGFKSSTPLTLSIAKILAPLVTFSAILFLVGEAIDRFLITRIWSGHVVIVGADSRANALLNDFRRKGRRVVLMVGDRTDQSLINSFKDAGAKVVQCQLEMENSYKLVRIHAASQVFLPQSNDAENISALLAIWAKVKNIPIEQQPHIFIQTDHPGLVRNMGLGKMENIHFFNYHMVACRHLTAPYLLGNPVEDRRDRCFQYDHGILSALDSRRPHLVLLGFSPQAQAQALHFAHLAHYSSVTMPKITVLGETEDERDSFLDRYPFFHKACELHFEPVKGDPDDELERVLRNPDGDQDVFTVSICTGSDRENMLLAVRMVGLLQATENIWKQEGSHSHHDKIPLLLQQSVKDKYQQMCQLHPEDWSNRVIPFAMVESICTEKAISIDLPNQDVLAQKLHESYQLKYNILDWGELDEFLRQSNRWSADYMFIALGALGYRVVPDGVDGTESIDLSDKSLNSKTLDLLASLVHCRWNAEKYIAGFTWGPGEQNSLLKTHPSLVEWDELGDAEREKDVEQIMMYPELLKQVGLKIIK